MWLIRSVVILVGVIGILWLGMTNADQRVDFNFFSKSFPDLHVNFLVFITFAAGMVFSFLIFVFSEFQLRHRISSNQREIVRLQRELSALRNLPLEEGESESTEPQLNI